MVSKGVTIVLDGDLNTKLRKIQITKIEQKQKHISFSKVVNDTLRKGKKL